MKSLAKLLVLFVLFSIPLTVSSQINLKNKIKTQTNNRANQRTDQGVNKGLDAIEGGIKDAFKKKDNTEQQQQNQEGQADQAKATDDASTAKEADNPAKDDATALESYSKYDFIPGQKVIFFEDFSQDAVGDFPALWNTNGSAEVVTTNLFPGKWMKFSGDKCVWTDNLLTLPENYTIEFDVIPTKGEEGEGMAGYSFRLFQCINPRAWDSGSVPGKAGFDLSVEYFGRPGYRTYINGNEGQGLGLGGYSEGKTSYQAINKTVSYCTLGSEIEDKTLPGRNKIVRPPQSFSSLIGKNGQDKV